MSKHFFTLLFFVGAAVLVWVGAGFMGSHLLALTVTLVIAAVYGFGALELLRFRQATASLSQALATIPEGLSDLGAWLAGVHPTLQNPVRLRIEGERIGLPGPALTPYLVGLLVMLGMLGTFLGMVVTLNGAVFALEGTPDLAAIRSAFATPIKGLGLAFGTSVAGVASSAMLGLLSALSRRERLLVAQLLDSRIATQLRGFSHSHQRQETYKALQLQSQALPQVVDQLQAMMLQMERMGQQMNERLLGNQQNFHSSVTSVYSELARSVDQSLRDSLSQSAQIAGDSLKPVVEAALSGMAMEARLMHERMLAGTQNQVEALSTRIHASAATVADGLTSALSSFEGANASMVAGVGQSLSAFNASFEQRASALLLTVKERYASLQAEQSGNDSQRLQAWRASLEAMAAGLHSEWQKTSAHTLAQQQQTSEQTLAQQQQASAQIVAQQQLICTTLTETAQQMADNTQSSAGKTLAEVSQLLASSEKLVQERMAAEAAWSAQFEQRANALLLAVKDSYAGLQAEHAHNDTQRLQDWRASLEAMAAGLQSEWKQTSAHTLAQQQQTSEKTLAQLQQASAQTLAQQQLICATLTETAQQMADSTQSSNSKTLDEVTRLLASSEELVRVRIATEAEWSTQHGARMEQITAVLQTELGALRSAEATRGDAAVERLSELQTALTSHLTTLGTALEDPITRLIETASEAPRAAAEVIGQLRQEISHSVARDNALLEERSRIMETLNTLLEGINHASAEQRAVIDALVASSAVSLTQAGEQFAAKVDSEAAKLADIVAHVSGSAVEVSTLGETFGFAVRSFHEGNEKLIANLQRIEAAMDKSMARSDDQLAYYVAQAREVIDLSIMSQKEVVEELRQLGSKQAVMAEETA